MLPSGVSNTGVRRGVTSAVIKVLSAVKSTVSAVMSSLAYTKISNDLTLLCLPSVISTANWKFWLCARVRKSQG